MQLAPLPAWRDPAITAVALAAMAIALVLSWIVVRKLSAQLVPGAGWRSAAFYLIPLLYGGAFAAMLVGWRVLY